MEKMLLSGEVLDGRHPRLAASIATTARTSRSISPAPSEGVLSLEQVLNVTPGSKVKELAFAYIDYMLRPDVQKLLAEAVWYSPANKKVKLDAKYDAKLLHHRGQGGDADPARLEMVQRAQGRHRRARDEDLAWMSRVTCYDRK